MAKKKSTLSTYAKANYKAEKKILLLSDKNFKVNALRNSNFIWFLKYYEIRFSKLIYLFII